MKEKCIVILSGGPDSVTTMYWAKSQRYDVYTITFDYGQKGKKEIKIAEELSKELEIPNKVVDLTSLSEIYRGVTSLVDENIKLTKEFSEPIIVPFRNGVFISIAVAYADSIGANTILYGAHASDEPYYPDCRKEFYKAFEKAANLGTGKLIEIKSPFSDIPKSEILKIASEIGVPLEETWSCYLSGEKHCGRCESCINRMNAFIEVGIKDPTDYE